MDLRLLSSETMLTLSQDWLADQSLWTTLSSHPLGAAMRWEVESAHELLAQQQGLPTRLSAEIAELTEALWRCDEQHDSLARTLHQLFDALVRTAKEPADAAWFHDTQRVLFPHGLSVINYSYADEAGAAKAVKRAVTKEMHARLSTVPFNEHTLAELLDAWLQTGAAMEELVDKRELLQASIRAPADDAVQNDRIAARRRWIRTVRTLLSMLELLELPSATRALITAPLDLSIRDALRAAGVDA